MRGFTSCPATRGLLSSDPSVSAPITGNGGRLQLDQTCLWNFVDRNKVAAADEWCWLGLEGQRALIQHVIADELQRTTLPHVTHVEVTISHEAGESGVCHLWQQICLEGMVHLNGNSTHLQLKDDCGENFGPCSPWYIVGGYDKRGKKEMEKNGLK